jgi:hypothetical protein
MYFPGDEMEVELEVPEALLHPFIRTPGVV